MGKEQFIGLWKLVSHEFRTIEGKAFYPYGDNAVGWVMFDDKGRFTAQIMRQGRPDYTAGSATIDDLRNALYGYVAYFGTFEIDESKKMLTNHVEGSLVPGWVGGLQIRFYEFSPDGRITLRTPPIKRGGIEFEGTLVWERI